MYIYKAGYVIMVEQDISERKALFLWAIVLEYLKRMIAFGVSLNRINSGLLVLVGY